MSRSNRRVLLVDDQPSFREGVRQLLSPYFEVTTAASGAEALTRCERGRTFAAVVSDYGMPGMTVVELQVASGDLGRVIGRQGRTAAAVRTLLATAADADGRRATLDIRDATGR